jgi:hypothetical protein
MRRIDAWKAAGVWFEAVNELPRRGSACTVDGGGGIARSGPVVAAWRRLRFA